MNRLITGIIALFFAFSGLKADPIWIKSTLPQSINAGKRFTVEITINKLDLQHFAELKQKLPAGFRVYEKESGAADFKFEKQVLKFTWLRLPRKAQIKISYEIEIDQNIIGAFQLPAQFTYIYKNQRGTARLKADKISVFAPGEVLAITNNQSNSNNNLNYPPKNANTVQCLRVKPYYAKEQKAFVVKLLVSRGNIKSAAKIEEKIPKGYTAKIVDSKSATFAFENNKVEFIWKKMPKQRNFEISYKLIPNTPGTAAPVIAGNFVYLSSGSLKTSPIKQVEGNGLGNTVDNKVDNKDVMDFFKE